MKKLVTLFAAISLMFVAVSAQAQYAAKVIGTYKMYGVATVNEEPGELSEGTTGKIILKKTDDNIIELTQIINDSETPIEGIEVVETNKEEGLYTLFLANSGGCIFGTVKKGKLEYTIVYKDDDTGRTNALTVYGKK